MNMKRLIKSLVAAAFCLPMAFAECKDGCDCEKCSGKEKAELTGCKEGCDCAKCEEKAKEKAELAGCEKCDKDGDKKEEGALA